MMKRHNDDSWGGGKRPRMNDPNKSELRALIQSKNAGAVIGKGGENIKGLRSTYNASLTVPDSNTPERVLTITADPDQALDCLREVIPKLDESKGDEDETELRMLIHQSHAGAVIGRAGFKIKELREETNTNLKVFSECCPGSSDRVLQITGSVDRIVEAVRAVENMLKEIPVKGPMKPYDTINYDPSFIYDYGGFPPDQKFRGGGGGGGGRGFGGGLPRGGGGGGGRYDRGGPGGGGGRFGGGAPPMDFGAPPMGGRGMGGGGRMGGGMRGGGGFNDNGGAPPPMNFGPPGGPMQTTQVTIPTELGGTIIGKGGERINRIRDDSGAHIVVDPPQGTSDERIITISGTQNQIQMAQYLLQQCVRSSVTGRKYIHDQQGR